MLRLSSVAPLVALVGLGFVVAGCQSDGRAKASASPTTAQAVMCPKCEVTWVRVPSSGGAKVTTYTSQKRMVCPSCKAAVENFFATGKLQHTCSICGGNLEPCEAH